MLDFNVHLHSVWDIQTLWKNLTEIPVARMCFVGLQKRFWKSKVRIVLLIKRSLTFYGALSSQYMNSCSKHNFGHASTWPLQKSTSLMRNKTIVTVLRCTTLKSQERKKSGHHRNRITRRKFHALWRNYTYNKNTQTVHWKLKNK